MAFCTKCGTELKEEADVCLNCGKITRPEALQTPVESSNNFWWGILGCCIPLVGLILYLVWREERPKAAEAAGIGAIIGFILWVIGVIL